MDQPSIDQTSIDQTSIDQSIIDQTEKKKNESVNKSGRMAILEEDKAREARRWQRKRETIKRFAGTK
ncbi:MAG: hypothetical protein ACYDHX_11450 [Methanothrix sp.]